MPSLIYDSMLEDLARGAIDFDTDNFKVMLVQSGYTPDKGAHKKRSAVTNEVPSTGGSNYASGGLASTVQLTLDTTNHRLDVAFSNVTWPNATITARAAVIYKSTGTTANDALVAYVDFGQDVSSTAAAFAVTFSSALRFQN
ncbi:hypothetical protein KIKIMORA_04010 [Brevundimonas phage vB_BpoS-Kikimora]|uniref:Uncharacterized protein n=1 Tax=Brevundimonas phage vB_BpoS-Kikimora TaxID=2948601 RepID=A0A9E7SLG5_9CAUD|nr:hypothetical protein KIKIMORA_04010 [Brevundimonas phage vB_BpoS-Kikimora]